MRLKGVSYDFGQVIAFMGQLRSSPQPNEDDCYHYGISGPSRLPEGERGRGIEDRQEQQEEE